MLGETPTYRVPETNGCLILELSNVTETKLNRGSRLRSLHGQRYTLAHADAHRGQRASRPGFLQLMDRGHH